MNRRLIPATSTGSRLWRRGSSTTTTPFCFSRRRFAQLAAADLVVASRFHGVVISFLLNKPVLALSHHPKVDSLMRDMGQSDFLLDIGTFDSKTVASRIVALESRSHLIKQQIRFNVATCRRKLESQYRDVFCPKDSPVSAGVERLKP